MNANASHIATQGLPAVSPNSTVHHGEPINDSLAHHQTQIDDWSFAGSAASLLEWAGRMSVEFKLDVGTPAFMIERLRRTRLGHYRPGRNGFGLRDEIAIDEGHIRRSERWDVLGTLAHELIHAWQQHHGKPGKGPPKPTGERTMARLLNAPFYENYSYDDGGFECRFVRDASTSLWAVEIRHLDAQPPVHTTSRVASRVSAYAQARAWCASRRTSECSRSG